MIPLKNGGARVNQKTMDMTNGNPLQLLIRFALPLMAGNIFQQMYILVDTAVVGNGVGVEALASIGAADWLNWLVLGTATGFTQGFSILIAQAFGGKDEKRLNHAVKTSFVLGLLLAVVLTIIAFIGMRPVLHLLQTPRDVMAGATAYLKVIFGGIIITMSYNLFAAVLRSLGNSKTPLVAMVIGSVTNIVLDCLFVYVFHWGISGAAIATIISQAIAVLYCYKCIQKLDVLKFQNQSLKLDTSMMLHLLKLGVPVALQNLIICLGGLVLQSIVNGYGVNFIAGYTASNKLYGLLEFTAISYGYAVATYVGQNLGAGKIDRIKIGMNQAIKLSLVTSVLVSVLMITFGKNIISLFVSADTMNRTEVISVAYTYLCVMASFLIVLFLLYMYRSALQGMGDTIIPMASGIVELCMRICVALGLTLMMGQNGIFLGEVSAWMGAEIILMASYYRKLKQL